jgi:hypothetical protein
MAAKRAPHHARQGRERRVGAERKGERGAGLGE